MDGVTGRETALFLNVWHDEHANVVRTPAPAPRRRRRHGALELSPVASTGRPEPAVPAGSGNGRRVCTPARASGCGRRRRRHVIRSYLVTGSKYNNEMPGFHEVYSRSRSRRRGTAGDPAADDPLPEDRHRGDRLPRHPDPRLPTGPSTRPTPSSAPACPVAAGARTTSTPQFLWAFADVGTPGRGGLNARRTSRARRRPPLAGRASARGSSGISSSASSAGSPCRCPSRRCRPASRRHPSGSRHRHRHRRRTRDGESGHGQCCKCLRRI